MAKRNKNSLTNNQQAFADEWLINGGNGRQAYLKVYQQVKNPKVAEAAASRLLSNVRVSKYIERRREELAKKTELTQEIIMAGYKQAVSYDIRKLFNENGWTLVPPHELPDSLAFVVEGIEIKEKVIQRKKGKPIIEKRYKYKFPKRHPYYQDAAKMQGMFKEDNKQKGLVTGVIMAHETKTPEDWAKDAEEYQKIPEIFERLMVADQISEADEDDDHNQSGIRSTERT